MSKEERDNTNSSFESFLEVTSKLKVPPSSTGKEAAWNNLMQSIEKESVKKTNVISISSRTVWVSIAATLLVLFTIASVTYQLSTLKVISQKGKTATIVLPDNSNVILNADSRIEYRRYGWLSDRKVNLKGEAYFSVKHGNRFTVVTEHNQKIVVTGTKFNVFARNAQLEVKCFEGSVSVETPKAKSISLVKGEGVRISKTEILPQHFETESIAAPKWTKGEFYFNNLPLNIVLDELSRQFNITVTSEGISSETRNYTGSFKHNNLPQALDLICIPMGFTYQISSDSTSVIIYQELKNK